MCVNPKGPVAQIVHALEVFSTIQIAVMLVVLIRMPSVCSAENLNAVSIYDPNEEANGRQGCKDTTCCSPPYEIEPRSFWSYAKTKYSCCVPNAQRNRINCCPYPLIPSKEPNVDPGFGPFCCDAQTGHCCSKLKISVMMQPADYVFSEPIGGQCCVNYDPFIPTPCCPRPMLLVHKAAPDLSPTAAVPRNLCCSNPTLCLSIFLNYDPVPSPRLCSPRGFCCPWPYAPLIKFTKQYVDKIPQFLPANDNQCASPTSKTCTLPQVPWYKSCIEQKFAVEVSQQDAPIYDIILPEFNNHDPTKTAASSNPQCLRNYVFRRTFGNPFVKSAGHSVAIDWFVTSPHVQRSKLLNETYVREHIWMWPDVIIPFIFPITIATTSVATALPALLLGAICWALVFNFRFLWVKKVRMAIRRIFVCLEKRGRIIQDNYLPPEDQRKFHARDRYQLPKALQDSDRSDDDEPEDLRRSHVDVIESHWTAEEIDALGFDPDNIPVDWIYGDLLGNPSALRKEVKAYNITARASGKPTLSEDDENMKQLDFEEWRHFLCKGQAGINEDSDPKRATLERKQSIQRYKIHKKIAKRRKVIRLRIKPSEKIHESPSASDVSKRKKKKKHKSKSKKKRNSRESTE